MGSKSGHALDAMRVVSEKEGVPRSHKVAIAVLAAVWWISPLDDMVIPTFIIDEIILTIAAIAAHGGKYAAWYGARQEKRSLKKERQSNSVQTSQA